MTKISVIIPNYNYGHYLLDAINSIIQTNRSKNYELIIIDDGSTDHSREILKQFEGHDSIRIFYHEKNLGVVAALNKGVVHSKGEFVHFFASDDLHLPGSIDRIIEYNTLHPEIAFFSSDFTCFHHENEIESTPLLPLRHFHFLNPECVAFAFRHLDFWIPGHTVFIKKAHLTDMPFNARLGPLCDMLVNHTLALKHGVGYIPESLVAMRRHPGALSLSLSSDQKKQFWNALIVLMKSDLPTYRPLMQTGLLRILGIKSIYKSLFFNPCNWKLGYPIARKIIERVMRI